MGRFRRYLCINVVKPCYMALVFTTKGWCQLAHGVSRGT